MQDEIGDPMAVEQRRDKRSPILEPAAIIGRRQAPKQPVAEMQVDAVHPVAARDQGASERVEKVRNRPL
jgi:hypothetical protein